MNTLKQRPWRTASVVGSVLLVGAAVAVSQQRSVSPPGIEHAEALSMTFRDVAKSVLPAVVSIETRTKAVRISNNGEQLRSPFEDEFLKRFFGGEMPPGMNDMFQQQQQIPQRRGSGSGFIIDSEGVILTNAHVVNGADRVTVTLHDGRELEAIEWHADPRADVAIIRVDVEERLPSVPLGDSSAMEIGDLVLALGNPFDIGVTVTSGIISAKGRSTGINEVESYLQTDAAINPGNSGGPLVNLRGEVIGINTAISSRSGGYDGVGFAIPVDNARWVADQLVATGSVNRAYLGVRLQAMDATLREQFGVEVGEGTLVAEVQAETPAADAGIEEGDVILEMAGQRIRNSSHLVAVVERLPVDKSYKMTVIREGEQKQLTVKLKPMPSDYTPALKRALKRPTTPAKEQKRYDELGLEVIGLDSDEAQQLSLPEDVDGVLIISVEPGSAAAEASLRRGDVIEKVGGKRVSSTEEFADALSEVSVEKGVAVLVRRGAGSQFVVLKSTN